MFPRTRKQMVKEDAWTRRENDRQTRGNRELFICGLFGKLGLS